jgi:hypothetical protein
VIDLQSCAGESAPEVLVRVLVLVDEPRLGDGAAGDLEQGELASVDRPLSAPPTDLHEGNRALVVGEAMWSRWRRAVCTMRPATARMRLVA